jgi:hypothetical protein
LIEGKPSEPKPTPEKPLAEKPLAVKPGQEKPASGPPVTTKPLATEGAPVIEPQASRPDVYYLRDKDGKLVPVPDFTYEDFKRLYDLDRQLADAVAPPRYVLNRITAQGLVEDEVVRLRVEFRLTLKTDSWVAVPLRLSGAVLRSEPLYDGPGQVLLEHQADRDGYVAWLRDTAEKPRLLTLDLAVPLRKQGTGRRLAFTAPAAAVSELRLTVPGQKIVAQAGEGATPPIVRPSGSKQSEIQVSGIGGEFQLSWSDSPAPTAAAAVALEATAAVSVRIEGPKRLTSEGRLRVRSYGAPLTSFRVRLPAGLEWFPLNEPGNQVALVETTRESGKAPASVVEVTLENKSGFVADVRLRAVTPAKEPPADARIETLGFEVLNAVRQQGVVDFVVEGDWSVTWPDRQNVLQMEVPAALRQQRVAARFEYYRQPCSLGVLVQPRQTRVYAEPTYALRVDSDVLRLSAAIRYRVRGPSAARVQLNLAGWRIDNLRPEDLFDRDQAREGADGLWTLPFATEAAATATQDFELRFEASRPLASVTEPLSAPLPRPKADAIAPTKLRVIAAENIVISPRWAEIVGGIPTASPMTDTDEVTGTTEPAKPASPDPTEILGEAGKSASQPLLLEIRGDVEQPRFVADLQIRQRQMSVGLDSRLRVEQFRIVVEQRFRYRVAYEPLRELRLAVPPAIADSGFQVFQERVGGELDALRVVESLPAAKRTSTVKSAANSNVASAESPADSSADNVADNAADSPASGAEDIEEASKGQEWRFAVEPPELGVLWFVARYTVPWAAIKPPPPNIEMAMGDESESQTGLSRSPAGSAAGDDSSALRTALATPLPTPLPTTVSVPLLAPIADAATRLAGNTLAVARDNGWDIAVSDIRWLPDLQTVERRLVSSELTWVAADWQDGVELEIVPSRARDDRGTVVRQVWVQSWFSRQWRQDRVAIRVQASDSRLFVSLPADAERADLLAAVDGRRVIPVDAGSGMLRIDWSNRPSGGDGQSSGDGQSGGVRQSGDERQVGERQGTGYDSGGGERTVELSYLARRPAPGSMSAGRLKVPMPKIAGARGAQRWWWQLVLPPDEHLLGEPIGWVAQPKWLWRAGWVERGADASQRDLEQSLTASTQAAPPPQTNQYLFSTFAPTGDAQVWVADRPTLVLLASGVILAAGLLVLYVPWFRHPLWAWGVSLLAIGSSVLSPSVSLVVFQAGLAGIVLALFGLVLRLALRRRATPRPILRPSTISVAEKPLSDLRRSRPDSAPPAPTATVPPSALGLLIALLAIGGATSAAAQDDALRFRRVLVREEQLPELARGYLPIARREFDELWAAAAARLPTNAPATRVDRADYILRWESSRLLTGQALLAIRHAGESAAFLSLEPCDLPLLEPRWSAPIATAAVTPVEPAATPRTVVAPAMPRGVARAGLSPAGVGVVVDADGLLQWRFSVRAEESGASAIAQRFRVRLPIAARQRIWLELPDTLAPRCEQAIVSGPRAETLLRDAPEATAAMTATNRVWWCLEWAGDSELAWTIESSTEALQRAPPFAWRQHTEYEVNAVGVELRASARLEIGAERLRELRLVVPANLQLRSVRLGDQSLSWTTGPATDASGNSEARIELPGLQGADRTLTVTAFAAALLDTDWSLPSLRLLDGFWQESTIAVSIYEPLQLQWCEVRGGRQTLARELAAPAAGLSLEAQFHDPAGAIAVRLGVPAAEARVLTGTSVAVEPAALTARVETLIQVVRGSPGRLSAEVPKAWIVDSVEFSPDTLVEDYSWEPAPRATHQRLQVRLRDPLSRERPFRLTVRAHRPRSANRDSLRDDSFRVLDMAGTADLRVASRRLVAVREDPATPLNMRADANVSWLSASGLSATETAILDANADYLFLDGPETARLEGVSQRTSQAYGAELAVGVSVLRDRVVEQYKISCEPRGAPVSRLVVLLSQSRSEPLSWRIADATSATIPARKLSADELTTLTRAAGEGWELQLRTARTKPFVVRAERTTNWDGSAFPLALISLPESETQRGTVRVETAGGKARLLATELERVPPPAQPTNATTEWLGGFRYDPARSPLLALETATGPADDPPVWAWTADLVSRYLPTGGSVHSLDFELENRGARQVQLLLPDSILDTTVYIDGVPQAPRAQRARRPAATADATHESLGDFAGPKKSDLLRQTLLVDLPAGVGRPRLRVEYRLAGPPLGPWIQLHGPGRFLPRYDDRKLSSPARETSSIKPRMLDTPELDAPVLAWRWLPMLPRNYRVLSAGAPRHSSPRGSNWLDFHHSSSRPDNVASRVGVSPFDVMEPSVDSEPLSESLTAPLSSLAGGNIGRSLTAVGRYAVERCLALLPFVAHPASDQSADAWMACGVVALSEPSRDSIGGSEIVSEIRAVDSEWLRIGGWTVFFLQWGWAAWATSRHPQRGVRRGSIMATGLLAIAPWVPDLAVDVLSGLFGGELLGLASGCLFAFWARSTAATAESARTSRTVMATISGQLVTSPVVPLALFVLLFSGIWPQSDSDSETSGRQVFADESARPALAEPSPVLFPVDDAGRPTGEYVHVPRVFYQELRRRARGLSTPLPGWIARSAQYRGLVRDRGVSLERARPSWEIPALSARWEIETLAPDQRVSLPLRLIGAVPLRQRIARDGVELESVGEWTEAGWTALLPTPGIHVVELSWRPTTRLRNAAESAGNDESLPLGDRFGFSQSIPRIPDSRLAIEFPEGPRWLELPGVRGSIVRDEPGREWRAELGPVQQFTIEGLATASELNPAMPVNVDQLAWVRFRPGSVTLETIWTFSATEGALPRLARLSLDPRLRWLPLSAGQPVSRISNAEPGQPWIQWEWNETVGSQARIRLSFLLAGATGVGQWRMPRLEPWNARLDRRWLAVSTDANLELQRTAASPLAPLPISEFQEAWGGAETPPSAAFRLSAGEGAGGLSTRFRDPRWTARTDVRIGLDVSESRISWTADIEPTQGSVWSHQIAVPPELLIDEVVVAERGRSVGRPISWTKSSPDRLWCPFDTARETPHELRLRGRLPTLANRVWTMPVLSVVGADTVGERVTLYRPPHIAVDFQGKSKPAPSTNMAGELLEADEFLSGWGRRLGQWEAAGRLSTDQLPKLKVRSEAVRVGARVGTSLAPSETGVAVELRLRMSVLQGKLDELRVELPFSWPDKPTIEPAVSYAWVNAPDGQRKRLLLRPKQPWTGDVELKISGPVAAVEESQVDVPEARLPDLDTVEYYLWLPRRNAVGELPWDTSGLQAVAVPESGRTPVTLPFPEWKEGEGTAFRVVAPRFRVLLRAAETGPRTPAVKWVEHQVFFDASFQGGGVSRFLLDGAGRSECLATLPLGAQLVDLRLDGRPVPRALQGTGKWRVELFGADWPQWLEVIYTHMSPGEKALADRVSAEQALPPRLAGNDAEGPVPFATIESWPVERSAFRLVLDGPFFDEAGNFRRSAGTPSETMVDVAARIATTSETARNGELHRLESLCGALERASDSSLARSPRELADWWPAWEHRFYRALLSARRASESRSAAAAREPHRNSFAGQVAVADEVAAEAAWQAAMSNLVQRVEAVRARLKMPARESPSGDELGESRGSWLEGASGVFAIGDVTRTGRTQTVSWSKSETHSTPSVAWPSFPVTSDRSWPLELARGLWSLGTVFVGLFAGALALRLPGVGDADNLNPNSGEARRDVERAAGSVRGSTVDRKLGWNLALRGSVIVLGLGWWLFGPWPGVGLILVILGLWRLGRGRALRRD